MASFVATMVRDKGLSSLYAGLPAALISIGPYMGLSFALYETSKSFLSHFGHDTEQNPKSERVSLAWGMLLSSLSGGFAGGVSKLAVFPFDTIKRRMQVQVLANTVEGIGHSMPKYRGMAHSFSDTLRCEGIRGLYKVLTRHMNYCLILMVDLTWTNYFRELFQQH